MKQAGYQPRTYRQGMETENLTRFEVCESETDLWIAAARNLSFKARQSIQQYRLQLERVIRLHPGFLTALAPWEMPQDEPADPMIREMIDYAALAGVGPMAGVAGAIAEYAGRDLLPFSPEIIVENGGDIFLKTDRPRVIGIYAGEQSPFTGKIGLTIQPEQTPLGICTSSGTVGHSLSFGQADAVVVLAQSAILADAVATMIGNIIVSSEDIENGIQIARKIPGIRGIAIIKNNSIGLWGEVDITPTAKNPPGVSLTNVPKEP